MFTQNQWIMWSLAVTLALMTSLAQAAPAQNVNIEKELQEMTSLIQQLDEKADEISRVLAERKTEAEASASLVKDAVATEDLTLFADEKGVKPTRKPTKWNQGGLPPVARVATAIEESDSSSDASVDAVVVDTASPQDEKEMPEREKWNAEAVDDEKVEQPEVVKDPPETRCNNRFCKPNRPPVVAEEKSLSDDNKIATDEKDAMPSNSAERIDELLRALLALREMERQNHSVKQSKRDHDIPFP